MTKHEIIDDTVAFYSADVTRRSKKELNGRMACVYKGSEGRECAFQRVVENDLSRYDIDTFTGFGYPVNTIMSEVEDLKFKEGYEGHDKQFWTYIQSLHDTDNYWDANGLSEDGRKHVESLKQFFPN